MRYDSHYSTGLARMPMVRAVPALAEYYRASYPVARAVMVACHEAYARGSAALDYERPIATRDLADLVHDAWHDGITRKDRITVRLVSGPIQCQQCACTYLDAGDTYCPKCNTGDYIGRPLTVYAEGPFAHDWAIWDGTIGGDTWETPSDMRGTAYAMPADHPGLVAEFRAEGYKLDLSEYES